MKRLFLILAYCLLSSQAWAIQVVSGSYVGDGTDDRNIVISPPCQPKAVFIKRDVATSNGIVLFASMGANNSGRFTSTTQGGSDQIQQFNSDGFQVGTSVVVNALGATIYYTALCDNGVNDFAEGTYSGTNADDRNIVTSPAFSPELVMVMPSSTQAVTWRGATSHSGDAASRINSAAGEGANYLQAFNADGFQVGVSNNVTGTTYYYIALKASAGVATGTFTGNTSDNRDITTNLLPKLIFIKGDSTTKGIGYRFGSNTGDASFCLVDASAANIIQAFAATTFQVGTASCANENTVAMRWFALTDFGRRRAVAPILFP